MLALKIIIGVVVGIPLLVGIAVYAVVFVATIVRFGRSINEGRTDELFKDD